MTHPMITLTHFRGERISVNPYHISAVIPAAVLTGAGETVDSQTQSAVVLSNGVAYHVREPRSVVHGLQMGLVEEGAPE